MVSHFRTRFSGDAGRDGRDAQTVPQPLVSRRGGRLHDGVYRAPAGHAHPGPEADSPLPFPRRSCSPVARTRSSVSRERRGGTGTAG